MTLLIVGVLSLIPFTAWYIARKHNMPYIFANTFEMSMDDGKELADKLEL